MTNGARGKKRKRRLLFAVLALPALAGLLVCLPFTPPGAAWLESKLETLLSEVMGLEVAIDSFSLHWPLEARMEKFTATDDTGGVRLEITDASARISARQLLRRKFRIRRLDAERMLFAGFPASDEPPAPATVLKIPDLDPLFESVEVNKLHLRRITLAPPLLPEALEFSLRGSFQGRVLSLESGLLALADREFSDPPQAALALTSKTSAAGDGREFTLEGDIRNFASLAPGWPEEVDDQATIRVTLRELRDLTLELARGELRTGLAHVDISGNLDPRTSEILGGIQLDLPELHAFRAWIPAEVEGALHLDTRLEGEMADPELDMTLITEGVRIENHPLRGRVRYHTRGTSVTRAGKLEADLHYRDLPLRLGGHFSRSESEIEVRDLHLSSGSLNLEASFTVEPGVPRVDGSLKLSVDDLAPFSGLAGRDLAGGGRIDAEITIDEETRDLRITTLEFQWDRHTLAAETPLHLRSRGQEFSMDPWIVKVDGGRLRIDGSYRPDGIDASVELLGISLSDFSVFQPLHSGAAVGGKLTLSGTPEKPEFKLLLTGEGLRPENPDLWSGPPARLRVEAALGDGRLHTAIRLEDLPGDPVTLDLEIPVALSLQPFDLRLPPAGEVRGRLRAHTDIGGLGRLFMLEVYHQLEGVLAADVVLEGTVEAPRASGTLDLENGRYENAISGTILRNLQLTATAGREFISLDSFQAGDGDGGVVKAAGRLSLRRAERWPFKASLTLNEFRLMKNDLAEARGHGELFWNGNLDRSEVSGNLRIQPVSLNLPERLPPRLYALEVEEIHAPGEGPDDDLKTQEDPDPVDAKPAHQMAFDLMVEAPDRFFVRGRGLDSEWSARLRLRGQTPEPVLTGSINLIRGRFEFFGKRLTIERGSVTFDGAFPPAPRIDIEARLRSGGITAFLRVNGPLDNPQIELGSTPAMPEDEILARMLFGREAARITPWQAVTLARALNRLRGGGGAFDLMGETRRLLGVDRIDVRTPEDAEEGTTVTVGKYVSDRVYVEFERGFGDGSGAARIELEITPEIRLETQTGDTDSGLDIIWSRDY